jgi:alcohol dehydrogenase (cytochrome c)
MLRSLLILYITYASAIAGAAENGPDLYRTRCSFCHGEDGAGGERGPAIASRIGAKSDADLAALIHNGIPPAGMPPVELANQESTALVAFLRTLHPEKPSPERIDTASIHGIVRNRNSHAMQVQGDDGRLHLYRAQRGGWRETRSGVDWSTYNGNNTGNRHSGLAQITPGNVNRLRVSWIHGTAGSERLQVTPVVVDGVMYVTGVNQAEALDAGTGQLIWQFRQPRTKGLAGDAAAGINRGVAVQGNRVFLVTDHAHLLALDRVTGALLWDTEMADYRLNYGGTSAPLVVGNLVISGISGGDEGVRGFLSAYKVSTGERVWRFWTVPAPGEPLAETWKGSDLEHGCATTWLTGTYDEQLDLLYWTTGNPCPDYNGDERAGDNLYSDSVLALRPTSGELAWHFQYTPHDLHDWDAQQTPMLIDTEWQGRPRKLLVQANRNGFFYVLDRTDGRFLRATPFVKKLTWANKIDRDGRPVANTSAIPTPEGVQVCPAVEGATNWFSSAFDSGTGLFYVQALEKCSIYKKAAGVWEAGKSFYNGSTKDVAAERGVKVLRAISLETGKVVWERQQAGPANSWGGVLSLASGVVFFGDDEGEFSAVNSRTGTPLWHFPANQVWKVSPMTYVADGKQYVAVAAGGEIVAFSVAPE